MKKLFKYVWFLSHIDSTASGLYNDDGGNGGSDVDGGTDGAAELATIKADLAKYRSEAEQLKAAKLDLEQRLDEADKELLSDDFLTFKESKSKPKFDTDVSELDLDRMSNREIYNLIKKEYDGKLDKAVKDFEQRLGLTKQEIGMISAKAEVEAAELKHDGSDGKPSFESLRKEIRDVAIANPTWNAEKCYRQAVLERKQSDEEKEELKRKKEEEEERTATEKVGVPGASASGKQLSKEEAARIAYRKAFGGKH